MKSNSTQPVRRAIPVDKRMWFARLLMFFILIFIPAFAYMQVKTFTVNLTSDEADPNAGDLGDDGACDIDPLKPGDQCTFRAAIQNHNGNRNLGQNEIKFNIPDAPGSGSIVIKVGSGGLGPLPNILGSVIIKGENEPDKRRIEIDGSQAGGNAAGLRLLGGGCRLSLMIINSFSSHGIFISGTPPPGGGGHVIKGNYIGTDSTGKVNKGNGGDGIYIDNTPNDSIGGNKLEDMNIISANKGYGIVIHGSDPLVDFQTNGASGIAILGNFIGLNADGNLLLPNEKGGVLNENAPNNKIGGETPAEANKIAGVKKGITVTGNLSEGVSILGNFIGKDGTGTKFSAGLFTRSGKALSIKANFITNIDSVGMDIYLDADGSYDILHNKVNGNVKAGTKFTFGPGRVIDVNYQNNIHRNNGTGLVIDESINSTINWLVTGDTIVNGGTGGNVIFRAGGKKKFDSNRWEANAGIGLKYAFDLGSNVNAMFILDGNVSTHNGQGGYDGDVKLSAQSVFTYSMLNLVGNENGKDGYRLALKATAGATSDITFAGKSDFSFNGGFGLAIIGDKVVLDVAKFTFEKSSARKNIDGAFYLLDVKFPFSITDNEITDNTGPGIILDGASFAHIDSNTIERNGKGILIQGLATARINNNTIIGNAKGVALAGAASGILISNNSIYNNTGPGIDLGDDGVTANHTGGPIPGPNGFQNFPVLTMANSSAGGTTVNGTLNAAANTAHKLEFFSNSSCDASGFGEGQFFLGTAMVVTDGSGNVGFSALLPGVTVPNGFFITATATDAGNNTSEFSNCILVGGVVLTADLEVTKSAFRTTVTSGAQVNFKIIVENKGPSEATDIKLRDSLPPKLLFSQAMPSTGTYDQVSGIWTIPSLHAGSQATLELVTISTDAGSFINLANIISAGQSDPVQSNNFDTALVIVVPVKTIPAMINDLLAQVESFERNGVMKMYPAADVKSTIRNAFRSASLSDENAAIFQLELFIRILDRMREIGYISASDAKILIDAAQDIIQQLLGAGNMITSNSSTNTGDFNPAYHSDKKREARMRTIQPMTGFLTAYPNPFKDIVQIYFYLDGHKTVALHVYDIHGRRIETLVNKTLPRGSHTEQWQPVNLPAGIYYLQLASGNQSKVSTIFYSK